MPAVILPIGPGTEGYNQAIARNEQLLAGSCFNVSNITDTTQAFEVIGTEVTGAMQWCLLISYSDINDYRNCFTTQEQSEMLPYDPLTNTVL